MTESARRSQILQTLERHGQPDGSRENMSVPLSRGSAVLPVITLSLAVPILNAKSFRIAPQLEDHPSATLVRTDPASPEAQAVVSDLVRQSHKYAEDLKESLKVGQDDPGVITRAGVLINANTRCVLMRELLAEGDLKTDAIRVAILPPDISGAELFDLEAVLQKQRAHKDDYNLVSELMMLKTLHEDAGMTPQQIASRQRLPSAKDVMLRFEILSLMERARHLVVPPLPISMFADKRSKLQNWKELLKRVKEIDVRQGALAGDTQIREWLQPFLAGIDSVHRLRFATHGWVGRHMISVLPDHGEIGAKIATAAASAPTEEAATDPEGLELLDLGHQQPTNDDIDHDSAVGELLKLTVAAKRAGTSGTVQLADGSEHTGVDVLRVLRATADKGLKDSKRRIDAGEQLVAPENLLKKTCEDFVAAIKAIDDVVATSEFNAHIDTVRSLLDDIAGFVEEANEILEGHEGQGPQSVN